MDNKTKVGNSTENKTQER